MNREKKQNSTRCVLCCPASSVPRSLQSPAISPKAGNNPDPCANTGDGAAVRAALAERGWAYIQIDHPLKAWAEVCLRQRAQLSRRAWELEQVERTALLLVGGLDRADVKLLLRAIEKYQPQTPVWVYEKGSLKCLQTGAIELPDETGDGQSPAENIRKTPHSNPPLLRMVNDDRDQTTDEGNNSTNSSTNGAAKNLSNEQNVSREELDMLLRMESEDEESK